MVNNILNELQERNKSLAEENRQLKERFGVDENNILTPAEVRQEIIRALSEGHYTNTPDEKLLDDIMTYYPGQNWPKFCKSFPVKKARQGHIILLYKFTDYWKNSFKLHGEIGDAKRELFTALQSLGSEESKKVVATFGEAREKGRKKYGDYDNRELCDITLKEIVKSITEWTVTPDKGFVEAKELAEQVKELGKFKEQVESLKKFVMDNLLKDKEKEDEEISYWEKGKLEELLKNIEDKNLNQTVIEVLKKWERDAKAHLDFIEVCEELCSEQRQLLLKEVADKSEMLQTSSNRLAEEISKNTKLQGDLEEKIEIINGNNKRFQEEKKEREELEWQLYLERKSLPLLPKKQNRFKMLGEKIKTKFQHLIKKEFKKQEFTAKVEVLVK